MKRIYYIVTIAVVVLVVAAYLYTRFSILKTSDPKPDLSNSESPLDLRPLITAKLRQLVKQGSDGLYDLSIEKSEPDIINSTVSFKNVSFTPNRAALRKLDSLQKVPDDIFNISFKSFRITGINVDDLLHQDKIDIDSIFVSQPVIKVYHDPKSYNKKDRTREDSMTLYAKIQTQVKHLGIRNIIVENGYLIHTNAVQKNRIQKFNDISIQIRDLLFDSATEFDKSRFLFSKQVLLSCKNYLARTPDSLYFFKVASVSIDAIKHSLTSNQVELAPRGNKQEFEKKLPHMENRFDIQIPKVVFTNIDWWALLNNEYFSSTKADMYNTVVKNYVDLSKSKNPNLKVNNFPQQLLMSIPLNVNIAQLDVHNARIVYEEYEPNIARTGEVHFDNINGTFTNITNVREAIKGNDVASFKGSGLFMHSVPLTAIFKFNLAKYKTGDFSVDVHIGPMDSTIVNPVAEPMGLISFKSGELQQANGHAEGNNFSSTGRVEILYKDLHITPLKRDKNDTTNLKKKTFTGFVANAFFIKDSNPSKGEDVRRPTVAVQRDHYDGFFRFFWKTMFAGILKTIGVPLKYMKQ